MMRTNIYAHGLLAIVAAAHLAGCASESADAVRKRRERVTYYDRNGDGRVDLEKHTFPGMADADWELRDTDFNGRYDEKVLFGVAIIRSTVDLPVPKRAKISRM